MHAVNIDKGVQFRRQSVYFRNALRLLVGAVFIFSGAVKAIDPTGTIYKFQDYFAAMGLQALTPAAGAFTLFFNTIEFALGVSLAANWRTKITSWVALAFMLIFTPLTLWLARTNAVPDCGCFGDAIKLNNWTTFYKNIILLTMVIYLVNDRNRFRNRLGKSTQWTGTGCAIVLALGWQVYTLYHLPVIDFRPWKTGSYIPSKMEDIPPKVDYTFIYRRTSDGVICNFNMDQVSGLSTEDYDYVDRKERIIRPGIPAEIQDFSAVDKAGFDNGLDLVMNPQFQFIVLSSNLEKADPDLMRKVAEFGKQSLAAQTYIAFITVHNGTTDALVKRYGLTMPVYYGDEIALKIPVRANPGVLLLKDGYVMDKWNVRQLPSFAEVKARFKDYDKKLAVYRQEEAKRKQERKKLEQGEE